MVVDFKGPERAAPSGNGRKRETCWYWPGKLNSKVTVSRVVLAGEDVSDKYPSISEDGGIIGCVEKRNCDSMGEGVLLSPSKLP